MLACLIFVSAEVFGEMVNPTKVYSAGGAVNSISVSDSGVVVGSEDDNAYFFDVYLRPKWTHGSRDGVKATAVSEDFVVVASMNNMITLLDHDGKVQWEMALESYVEYPHAVDIEGETIAIGTRDGYLQVFDTSRRLIWKQKTDAYLLYVRIRDNSIVAVSDKQIYVFSLESEYLRSILLESYVRSAHISEDYVVVGLGNNELHFFDLDGTRNWSYRLPDQIGSVYASKNYVAAGLRDRGLYLFSANGRLVWDKYLSDSVTAVAADGNLVLASTLDNRLYLFNTNRISLWEYETEGWVKDAHVTNSGIFVGTSSGEAYYFRTLRDVPSTIFVLVVTVLVLVFGFIMFLRVFR